jgi:hypothetical protein
MKLCGRGEEGEKERRRGRMRFGEGKRMDSERGIFLALLDEFILSTAGLSGKDADKWRKDMGKLLEQQVCLLHPSRLSFFLSFFLFYLDPCLTLNICNVCAEEGGAADGEDPGA